MTAITKYFVGGEVEAFYAGSDPSIAWSTTAGVYDSDFSRGAVFINANFNSQYIRAPLTSAQTNCWASFQSWRTGDGNSVSETWVTFVNVNLTPIYRIQGIGGNANQPIIQFQYWNGSSWIAATGIALVVPSNQRHKFDFQLNSAASGGRIAAYIDGVLLGEATGNTVFTTPNAVAELNVFATAGAGSLPVYISECQILDVSTLGRRLYTLGETANGINSQWTGAYTDINEVGTFNDSNFIQTGTVNQTSTFVTSTISSTPAQQYLVSGLVVAGRILIGAVGPQNMKGSVVVGGTTYNSTNDVANLVTDFGYTWADFPENPSTGLDWTISQINAGIETGWESLT